MVKHTWIFYLLSLLCILTIILQNNSVSSKKTILSKDGLRQQLVSESSEEIFRGKSIGALAGPLTTGSPKEAVHGDDVTDLAVATNYSGSSQEAVNSDGENAISNPPTPSGSQEVAHGDDKIHLARPVLDSESAEAVDGDVSEGYNEAYLAGPSTDKLKHIAGFLMTADEIKKFHMWPNGYIPYYIDVKSFGEKGLRDNIRSFLNTVNSITPLEFSELPAPPKDEETRFVFFINRIGLLDCANHSMWDFTNEGAQRVQLGYHCLNNEGELLEAVMAIAGVPAQHTAPNRDDYIKVFLENVEPGYKKFFNKLSDSDWLFHDLPYDYDSIGHFNSYKYSMNGKTVIKPLKPDITVGEKKGLSLIDIKKIKLLYSYKQHNAQHDVPTCHKLFQYGSKFKSYKPSPNIAKPQRKPIKYTGNNTKNLDYIDDEVKNLNLKYIAKRWTRVTKLKGGGGGTGLTKLTGGGGGTAVSELKGGGGGTGVNQLKGGVVGTGVNQVKGGVDGTGVKQLKGHGLFYQTMDIKILKPS